MIREDYTHDDTKKSACHHLADDEEFVRRLVQETLNEVLESEMTEFLGARARASGRRRVRATVPATTGAI